MRVALIVGAWLATLVATSVAYVQLAGERAIDAGRERYAYRTMIEHDLESIERRQPALVWMGDSTILGITRASYPQLVSRRLRGATWSRVACFGCDFFAFYPLAGEILAHHRPAILVLVAHLRFFRQPSSDWTGTVATRNDLLSWVPANELGTAMRLPLGARGVTIPRLLLARLLRYDVLEDTMYLIDGARASLAEAESPWLGPNRFMPYSAKVRAAENIMQASDVRLDRDQPTVRMMEATVRLATRHGVRVVVVGSPVPPSTIGYDPEVYRQRFELLRAVVEESGGVFVDLHDALPDEMFADPGGHFTSAGTERVAGRIRPVLAAEFTRRFAPGAAALP